MQVPRSRFAPVKTTNDLLILRSDVYKIAEDATVQMARPGDEVRRQHPTSQRLSPARSDGEVATGARMAMIECA